ncbi:hypothetical protein U0070_005670 [Myodes glareolus]|uniref:Uncharacterized protein n=1 Tax=Myodes glareolus TaxID=447135 RepID=A0AAW0IMA1_MYOGA
MMILPRLTSASGLPLSARRARQVLQNWALFQTPGSSQAFHPSLRAASPTHECTIQLPLLTPRPSRQACPSACPPPLTTTPTCHHPTPALPKARVDPSRPAARHISTMALRQRPISSPWYREETGLLPECFRHAPPRMAARY